MNKLIAYLVAISNYTKDIHYTTHGSSFYSKHILVDLISDPISGYLDTIKEVCLLGRFPEGERPLRSTEYNVMANDITPDVSESDDVRNFQKLQSLVEEALVYIQSLSDLSRGEENVVGAIAEHLQKTNGLLNLQNHQ